MVLQFKKDGTIDGEYNEIIEEDGQEFPWTEVYRGEYKKTGEYLDMVLNGDLNEVIEALITADQSEKLKMSE